MMLSAPTELFRWIHNALALPALTAVGSLAAVIVAAVALVSQTRAQRETNQVSSLLHDERRLAYCASPE